MFSRGSKKKWEPVVGADAIDLDEGLPPRLTIKVNVKQHEESAARFIIHLWHSYTALIEGGFLHLLPENGGSENVLELSAVNISCRPSRRTVKVEHNNFEYLVRPVKLGDYDVLVNSLRLHRTYGLQQIIDKCALSGESQRNTHLSPNVVRSTASSEKIRTHLQQASSATETAISALKDTMTAFQKTLVMLEATVNAVLEIANANELEIDAETPESDDVRTPRPAKPLKLSPIRTRKSNDWKSRSSGKQRQRTTLPAPAPDAVPLAKWQVTNEFRLEKPDLPISGFEPLTELQMLCEWMSHSELLDQMTHEPDAVTRMALLAAFSVAVCSELRMRKRRPLMPLLGETFEYYRPDKGWRYLAEQVSLRPRAIAAQAHGDGWTWIKNYGYRFRRFSAPEQDLELENVGDVFLSLQERNEQYHWDHHDYVVHNVLTPGKFWIGHEGKLNFRSTSGLRCVLRLPKPSKAMVPNQVNGKIFYENEGKVRAYIHGQYSSAVYMKRTDSTENQLLFEARPPAQFSASYYGFSPFTMTLNQLHGDQKNKLPPTDSRLRPDVRLLEKGRLDCSAKVKRFLDDKQKARKDIDTFEPLWFQRQKLKDGRKRVWVSNGEYWKKRAEHFKAVHHFPKLW